MRESEERRRRKFQNQIETLRKLLFQESESTRVTREAILDRAIKVRRIVDSHYRLYLNSPPRLREIEVQRTTMDLDMFSNIKKKN